MKKKTIGILVVLALVAVIFAGCAQGAPQAPAQPATPAGDAGAAPDAGAPAAEGGNVRIAVAAPLTGDNAEYGQGFLNAARLQAEHRNAAGGVLGGRQVEIVPFDDANSSEEAASIALRIASDGDFAGVIGHFSSGVAMTAAPTYNENQIINISPSAGHVDFSGIGEFIFRNNTVVVVEAGAILDIAVTDLGHTRIGILSIMTDWGVSTSDVIMNLVDALPGVEVVAHEEVMEGSPDFSPAITAFEAADVDVVISVSQYSTLAPFAIQYRTINPEVDILGFSNAYTRNLIDIGGESVERVRFPVSFFADSPDPVIQAFVSEYIAANGYSPSALTAQAFDAVGILLDAIDAAGTTEGEPVRQMLHEISHNGVAGVVSFDAGGDVMRDFFRVVIQDGEFRLTN
ncbi:MAG: ABC transporter substrate-binding protein [Oscillospiraceae bacterium]|nr:ABC transporter substrate-binding protein [Oscillospiraceae bacterium]